MDRRIVQAALDDQDPLVMIRELVPFAAACGTVGMRPVHKLPQGTVYIGGHIDSGGFNRVSRAEWHPATGGAPTAAVARLMLRNPQRSPKTARMWLTETALHAILSTLTPAVPRLLAPLKIARPDGCGYRLGTVTEMVNGKTFYDMLQEGRLDNVEALSVLASVFRVLCELGRAAQFVHRDLRADNVVVKKIKAGTHAAGDVTYPSHGLDVSLIDFGLSRLVDPTSGKTLSCDTERMVRGCSTPRVDVAMILFTIFEDCYEACAAACPAFYRLVNDMARPCALEIKCQVKGYDLLNEDDKQMAFQNTVYDAELGPEYEPSAALLRITEAL